MTKNPKKVLYHFYPHSPFLNLEIGLYIHTITAAAQPRAKEIRIKAKQNPKKISFSSHSFSFSKPHQTPLFLPFFFIINTT
jgi:hypothetical protein